MTDADRLKEIDAYFTAPPNHLSWRQIARELFAIARRALERADKAEADLACAPTREVLDKVLKERDAARVNERHLQNLLAWRTKERDAARQDLELVQSEAERATWELKEARAEADALRAALAHHEGLGETPGGHFDLGCVYCRCHCDEGSLAFALSAGAAKAEMPEAGRKPGGEGKPQETAPAAVTPACEVLKGCRDPQSHWHHIWVEAAEPKETRSGFSSLYSGTPVEPKGCE